MSLQVRDVMGRVAIAVQREAPFAEIVTAMRRFAVGAVTVIDADRHPVGIVSGDDLLLKETDPVRHSATLFESPGEREERGKAAGLTAAQLMTHPAITVTPATPVREAARLMHEKKIKQLPVIDPVTGRMTGTVHQQDLLKIFARPPEELLAEVAEVVRDEVGLDPASLSIGLEAGIVTIGGHVARRSQSVHLVQAVRRVEGVIDAVPAVTYDRDDIVTPPFR
ncbi:CBS domain-containing protein [Planobispora siamensis]|uniref:CBS domain-containing protein n=1 Tax=Planobispora siamensis TaxID=936338 RepID=A0A8J3WSD1_9ACTN|nr:CBS domain-containing protein [Planobispora siamensis]GIH97786.1 hypothetical protein Psi01_84160 [Planobispora siamensis]